MTRPSADFGRFETPNIHWRAIMIFRRFLMSAAVSAAFLLPHSLQAGTVYWPCSGSVTSPYGPRSSPCSGCSTFHHGIDIGVGTGTDLGAPWNGTVTSYAFDSCGGNIMKIGFGGGWESRFLHLSARVAAVGAAVVRNQHVAESGGTGSCTTGPHLHFEMRKDGVSQSIPGSTGTWVTRNAAIPKDFPGCGAAPFINPPFTFGGDAQGWTPGNAVTGFTWTNCCGWPGIIYCDQVGTDSFIYSPATSFGGAGNQLIHVRVFPQSGSSANHEMQAFWKTNSSNVWDAAKSSNVVSYVAQDTWHDVYLGLNGTWTGQTINQIRIDFDQANTGTRWIVDTVEVVNIVQPPYNFDGDAQGFAAGNGITGFTWTNCCGWPGIIYGDQVGNDAFYYGPRSYFGGGSGDWVKVRVFPQAGNTANHDMQIHWATTQEPGFSGGKASPTVNYVAQDTWTDVYCQVGNNALWAGKTIIQLRVDFDQTNHGNRWIVDSVQISGPPPTPPAAPSGLVATAASNSQINLGWTDNSNNESSFIVKRSTTSGGPYTNIATVGANVTSYSNLGLAANTTYYYVVEATGAGGNSGNSNQASATTLNNPPNAPSGLAASSPNTTQINLSWTDNSSDESNFVVGRSPTSGGPYTDIVTLGANVTSYNNTGLTANTTYYYVVRATNGAGASANSNQASAITWPNEIVIDNTGTFTATANWSTGTSSLDKFGADYRFRPTAAISDAAVWNVTIPQTRNYQIFAWWAQGSNRSTTAPYLMPDNASVPVNQQTGGGAWQSLAVKNVAAGAATVKLSCWTTTGFIVVADGVRLVPQ